jgi:hypothetical protein
VVRRVLESPEVVARVNSSGVIVRVDSSGGVVVAEGVHKDGREECSSD